MGTTPVLKLPYPDPTTNLDIAEHIKQLAEAIDKALSAAPTGLITSFKGTAIPSGWHICDGTGGTPNLTHLFVMGTGTGHALGAKTGADTVALTAAMLPSHTHPITGNASAVGGHGHGGGALGGTANAANAPHSHGSGSSPHHGLHELWKFPPTSTKAENIGGSTRGGGVNHLPTAVAATFPAANAPHAHGSAAGGTAVGAGTANPPAHTHTKATNAAGTGTAISIVPPFYSLVYMMKV